MAAPSLTTYSDGQGTIFADSLNTFEQTCDTFTDLQAFVGVVGQQISVRGGNSIGDGLGGDFYWNENGTANDGMDNIQPFGAAIGTWTRLTVIPNSVLIPFERSETLPDARAALGLGTISTQNSNAVNITGGIITNTTISGLGVWLNETKPVVNVNYTVLAGDSGLTLALSGGFFNVTFSAVSTYSASFVVAVANIDTTRGKLIVIPGPGVGTFMLWPNQSALIFVTDGEFKAIGNLQRWYLGSAGSAIFYVTPGAGSGDGLGPDAPIALQTAINFARNSVDGGTIVVQCADATYNGPFDILGGAVGYDVFIINGNPASPSNVKIIASGAGVDAIFCRDGGRVELDNLELACGAGGSAVSVSQGGVVDMNNVIFGDCSSANAIALQEGGAVNFVGPIAISGNFSSWIFMEGGYVSLGGQTITITQAVSGSFILDMVRGAVESNAGTAIFANPGNYTGTSYNVTANGVFVRNGTTLPGSAGSTSTGGQVI